MIGKVLQDIINEKSAYAFACMYVEWVCLERITRNWQRLPLGREIGWGWGWSGWRLFTVNPFVAFDFKYIKILKFTHCGDQKLLKHLI